MRPFSAVLWCLCCLPVFRNVQFGWSVQVLPLLYSVDVFPSFFALITFLSLLDSAKCRNWWSWKPCVLQSDASLHGWALAHSLWPSEKAQVPRTRERSRFCGLGPWSLTWKHVRKGVWRPSQDIYMLEALAMVLCQRRLARTQYGGSVRLLFLCDTLGVVLAFERCRSNHFGFF